MNNQSDQLATVEEHIIEEELLATKKAKNSISEEETESLTKMQLYRRRFLRNKGAVFGLVVLVILVLMAIIGPFIAQWPYDEPDFLALSQAPSASHWFGTDAAGLDLFAEIAHGLGRSLTIAITVSVVGVIISAIVGCGAAYLGGRWEKIILGLIHFLLVVPTFLILAMLVGNSGGDWKILIVALIAFGWMYSSRVVWSLATSVREREYVKAARFMGVPGFIIVIRHIVPNIGSLLIINLALGVVSTVMAETGLSFLGLGVKPPDVSLGTLLGDGVNTLQTAPWQFYFPAGILTLLTVSMALIADGLRDALDPNSASGGAA